MNWVKLFCVEENCTKFSETLQFFVGHRYRLNTINIKVRIKKTKNQKEKRNAELKIKNFKESVMVKSKETHFDEQNSEQVFKFANEKKGVYIIHD